ncbi:hypothetical protein cgR_5042 [Corynebacterium glutamicum R]|uniref:Secreted protein n=1 Tax=Corynebacterium glutamicum (strain R) TaxID=340322 RepID=A0AB72VCC9_CORGB|nr:hypothetical protein cgR_5042 [Corynebacterium glutamicum R]
MMPFQRGLVSQSCWISCAVRGFPTFDIKVTSLSADSQWAVPTTKYELMHCHCFDVMCIGLRGGVVHTLLHRALVRQSVWVFKFCAGVVTPVVNFAKL